MYISSRKSSFTRFYG